MIVTDVTFTVMPDEDYCYEVCAGQALSLTYKENSGIETYVAFGSVEEMRAVAKAMLKACEVKESV
jgi:hypothetical protein